MTNESIKELADAIYREKVRRARALSVAERIQAGFELFENAVEKRKSGIRMQFPGSSDAEVEIAYMLVGGHSSMAYGIPRSTKDADIVLSVEPSALETLANALGNEFQLDPQGSFEMVKGTMRYHLRIPSADFEIELFLLITNPHDQARFERRVPVVLGHLNGVTARIPTA